MNGEREQTLSELLPPERIKLHVKVNSWQQAVQEVGSVLLQTGAIEERFIDAMIQTTQELGPYIVIAPGIALPHAQPEAGAKKTALSMIKLDEPIEFGNPDNDPVEIVIGLSAVDNKKHVKALSSLAELLLNKEKVAQLFRSQTKDELFKIFQEF